MNVLCVIPARSGSKRVKNKNTKFLGGIPLVAHTILSAQKSKLINDICLTTDSIKIKKIGLKLGLDVPFLRSKSLSSDSALSIDVVKDSIEKFEKYNNTKYDYVLLLQPTCPFRENNLIDKCINTLKKKQSIDSLITVCDVGSHHPFRMKYMNKQNLVKNIIDQGFEDMRPIQRIKKVFIRSGSIYLTRKKNIMKNNSLVGKKTYGVKVKDKYAINIDTIDDFLLAKKYLKK